VDVAPADIDAILAYGANPQMVFARLCLTRGWPGHYAKYVWQLVEPIIKAREAADIPF